MIGAGEPGRQLDRPSPSAAPHYVRGPLRRLYVRFTPAALVLLVDNAVEAHLGGEEDSDVLAEMAANSKNQELQSSAERS